jgi:hypothetical protein
MAFADTLHGFVGGDQFFYPPQRYPGGTYAPYFARTSNSGADWDTACPNNLTSDNSHPQLHTILGLAALSKDTLVCVGEGISMSSDGGNNWLLPQYTNEAFYDVTFPNKLNCTAVGSPGFIVHTTDGGLTWVKQNSGTTNGLHSVAFVDSVIGYASGENGTILKTTNGGLSWVNISPGISDLVHAVSYPEPCNTSTKLSFSLPEPQHVWLSFFDMNGRKVGEYFSGILQSAGSHTIAIDTRQYLSGQYTYDLITDKYYGTGKITVLH